MQNKEYPKLRNCPFCGGKAKQDWGLFCYEVYCTSCHVLIRRDGKEEAIEAWNRRAEA